ncbi:MAG: hypothetical protein LBS89_04150 [Zoogloeaceae bacterium]|jgi:predicted metal-dependent HD superfamily phosphohydrolase|nr:hypothetical protein [Zoogloeaceae bacterium]
MNSLQSTFLALTRQFTPNVSSCEKLWDEIAACYSEHGRHYHTLRHLEYMLYELQAVKASLHDPDAVLFALYYHDIIYAPGSDNNEEESADLAAARLAEISCPSPRIQKVVQMILATKDHAASGDSDTDFLTDADLSLLGVSKAEYRVLSSQIRQEYARYPAPVYHAGRKQVLRHFLSMPQIFKTRHFYEKFEGRARENLEGELRGFS